MCCDVFGTERQRQSDFVARLQWVAVYYRVLQCVAVFCIVSQCVAVNCSVLQCVAVCCSVWYRAAAPFGHRVTCDMTHIMRHDSHYMRHDTHDMLFVAVFGT